MATRARPEMRMHSYAERDRKCACIVTHYKKID